MKLQFKHQKFQADAAKAVVDVFAGQPYLTPTYMMDRGLEDGEQQAIATMDDFTGWRNERIVPELSDSLILEHLQKVQRANQIKPSDKLEGRYNLTIEMETGVGKTYTYIKTMYELNKHYGWSKFIVVVPSIAIREGVYKSFQVTQEHFAEEYGKKIRFFIYNSAQLTEIDRFASDSSINVMIINTQAFAASMNEDKNVEGRKGDAAARIIYTKRDEFGSRRPIDVIKANRPIIILDEPTRFIFSHSALREGWDNPNVFQICTLKHSDSNTAKRQEVGRGLRLCVNQDGNRMDVQSCGDSVHEINTLTVVASESYKTFVTDLQSDIKTVLYNRPTVATSEYFKGKYVKVDDVPTLIDDEKANAIEFYLIQNVYVDMKRKVTDKYRQDVKNGTVAELPEELKPMTDGIHTLIQAVYDDSVLKDMFFDGHETKVKDNPLNENFDKKEFQALWREINHKYAYTVDFDSAELIRNAIAHIDEKLFVSELQYTTTIGRQKTEMNKYEIERGASFTGEKTRTQTLKHAETSQIKYDLIEKIAEGIVLTRRTASAILQGIRVDKLYMFKNNPEEFITKVIRLINEQKATMIVEHISYDTIEGEYDSSIFTAEKATQSFDKAYLAKKAIQDYVFTDGSADKSIERNFAEDLDAADEVCVYAKLPRTFQIPTPVGNYSPDWAIAFYEGKVKHIFFIAETKGTMESLELRPIEQAKISCAKKLFNELSTNNVVYHDVDSYQSLLNIMNSL